MKLRDAAFWREYRARRREAGNPVRDGLTKWEQGSKGRAFIGFDGEGIERDGRHVYALLCSSRGAYVEDENGISAQSAFEFILGHTGGSSGVSKSLFSSFGFDYDIAKILESLSGWGEGLNPREPGLDGKANIAALLRNESRFATWFDCGEKMYALRYVPGKYFQVSRFRDKNKRFRFDAREQKKKADFDASATIWDIRSFFRSTFLHALKEMQIPFDAGLLEEMKARRGTFTAADLLKLRAYCIAECEALALLHERMAARLHAANMRPRDWHGPGSVATKLLEQHGVRRHVAAEPDEETIDVLARASFGGRAECMRVGRVGKIWSYDIASAYAAAAADLPSLQGRWSPDGLYGLERVSWAFPSGLPWYPLPYRDARGAITFASTGAGWYWQPEVAAARAFVAVFGGTLDTGARVGFTPFDLDARPFGFVDGVYEQRRRWRRQKSPLQWTARTALSALYGKTAQQKGARADYRPTYYSLAWSSRITAVTRAKLVLDALYAPDAVVAMATDCIYFDREVPLGASDDADLGGRRLTVYEDAVWAQAGVYWAQRSDGVWEHKSQGYDRESFAHPSIVLRAYTAGFSELACEVTRFVSLRSACASDELWELRGTWRTIPRKLDLTGRSAKREALDLKRYDLSRQSVALVPKRNEWFESTGDLSYPYATIAQPEFVDGVPLDIFLAEASASAL